MMRFGVNLAKSVFQVHGVDDDGEFVRKRLSKQQLSEFFAKRPRSLIGMEACSGAHYWARLFQRYGHDVRLIAPQFVKPYVFGNKNDGNDAEGICEAVGRPNMRFVAVKTPKQTSILILHRVRERLIAQRTALVNQTRGYLAEFGISIRKGIGSVRASLPSIIDDESNNIPPVARETLRDLDDELRQLDHRIVEHDKRLKNVFNANPECQKIAAVEGVGVLTATAFVATLGDPGTFENGRQVAAWLGLTPREHSSGTRQNRMGITKRGDRYLRKLLVHGARSALRVTPKRRDLKSRWVERLRSRTHENVAAVALAARNARVLWAILAHQSKYDPEFIN